MLFLILSFICSAILILLFKVFEGNGIPVFTAIVFNYWTAAICGFINLPEHHSVTDGSFITNDWLPLSVFLGMLFINVFNLTSITTLRFGVSTASVASKLGLVFPVVFAFALYNEHFNWMKGAGILFALVAVVLSSLRERQASVQKQNLLLSFLPAIVFTGNGACDSLTQFANKRYLMYHGIESFSFFLFLSAAFTGTLFLAVQLFRGRLKIAFKSVVGGIALGIPNYLAFIFILKALATLSWGSSVIFPVANLGTVACASITGFIVFKEKISRVNMLGLLFAVVAITFIILSEVSR